MKRIIEIPDKVVEAIQNGEDYRYDIHTAIAQSVPYNPSGDCISREALKDEVRKHAEYYADRTEEDRYNVGYTECACEILDFIDNAPTVPTFTLEDMQNNWDDGAAHEAAKHDREKGEWEIITFPHSLNKYKCNQCQHYLYAGMDRNFCPNCGADMRGDQK